MSDNESSNVSENGEEVVMYRCRHCPNEEFTAAERDLHRQQHRQNRRSARDTSPITLFEPITTGGANENVSPSRKSPARSPRTNKKNKPMPKSKKEAANKKSRKIRSEKRYDRHVEQPANNGG